jgi:hypothetical protein
MHMDIEPLLPFSQANELLRIVSVEAVHKLCGLSGLVGAAMYFAVRHVLTRRANALDTD